MYFRTTILISLLFLSLGINAQKSPVLFSVDGKNVNLEEFSRVFSRNNQYSISENKELTRNYLQKYIDFKFKVAEAYKQKLNRRDDIKDLIQLFKDNLIRSHIVDKELVNKMVDEVYQRMKTEIKVKHMLISVHRYADPKDTLRAYQKALAIRTNLVNGKNFNELAIEVSDAPGAAVNKGDLGYINVFKLPYNIESYIYQTNSDKYSLPLRSNLGYHIVKVIDKRPAQGYFSIKHIMIGGAKDTNETEKREVKRRVDELYSKLSSGESFELLANEYSEDISSNSKSEALPWFGTGFMPENIEKECVILQKGRFSRPLETRFGWHIIKKIDEQNGLISLNKIREQVERKVIESARGKIAKRKAINRLKKQYNFIDYQTLPEVWKNVDSTIFEGEWAPDEFFELSDKLFEFNNRTYYQKDFVNYLKDNQEVTFPIPIKNYVYIRYKEFVDNIILKFEIEQVEKTDDEFSFRLRDYQETILVNNLMEQEVWSKLSASPDELKSYYNKNKSKYNANYQADVTVFEFSEELKKIEKQFKKLKKNGASDEELVARIKANIDIAFDKVEKVIIEEGEDALVDKIIARHKIGEINNEKMFVFEDDKRIIWLNSRIIKTNKELDEVKKMVANDYKAYFENNWLRRLKRKYSLEVNENVFESIFN